MHLRRHQRTRSATKTRIKHESDQIPQCHLKQSPPAQYVTVRNNVYRGLAVHNNHIMVLEHNAVWKKIWKCSVDAPSRRAARWQHIARYSQRYIIYCVYVCRYISEQKATFCGRTGAVRGEGGGPTHTRASPPTLARAASSVYRANRAPTDRFAYSYYYERRNAFCRARTKFVVLRLPIIKIVNAFQCEVCAAANRCRLHVLRGFPKHELRERIVRCSLKSLVSYVN